MNFTISNEFHNFQWISQFQLNFIISTEFHHFKWISTFQRNFTISTEFYHFNLIWPFLCTQLVLPKIKKSWTKKSQNLERKQFTLFNHQYHILRITSTKSIDLATSISPGYWRAFQFTSIEKHSTEATSFEFLRRINTWVRCRKVILRSISLAR